VSEMTSGRPPVEHALQSPGARSAPPSADLAREREVRELANLLAVVVELAGSPSSYPGHWEQIAEDAMEHASVRTALAAAEEEEEEEEEDS
jgi:hypothetical protein